MRITASDIVEIDPSEVGKIDISFLPFAAKNYHISPDINDYVIFTTAICPADIPNRNGIAFPLEELAKFTPTPSPHFVYKGWIGCPVHEEHINEDPTKAVGVIFDTSLVKMPEEYGDGKLYNVIGVLGIDKKKRPDLAKAFANGDINTVSMGALASYFTCSICGAVIDDEHKCQHITSKDAVNFKPFEDVDGNIQLAFLNAHELDPIETSIVKDPAWAPALSDTILQK